MSTLAPAPAGPPAGPPARRRWVGVLRVVGWAAIAAGAVVLLYLVYSLLFTNLETSAAQAELLERWELEVGAPGRDALPGEEGDAPGGEAEPVEQDAAPPAAVDPGGALAVLEFARPGSDVTPVREDPLFVVEDVSLTALQRGPGHYPESSLPGEPGNFAVAGHRSTYGAPFFSLEELAAGDEVHVTARDGARHVYVVREQRIVAPGDVWVIGHDPLGTGRPTLTLTTCHPRFSNAERLIVFAELAP